MMRGSPAGRVALAVILGCCAAARPAMTGEAGKTRTVTVLVLGDESFRRDARWKIETVRMFVDANSSFRPALGVRFAVKTFDYWDPAADRLPARSPVRPGRPSLRALLGRLAGLKERRLASSDPAEEIPDIVLGIVPPGPEGLVDPGIADYLHGLIVLKRLPPPGSMSHSLFHELCHLFGAIDLEERGSVMSLARPTFGIDPFTLRIMRTNRERSFRPGDFPLDEDGIVAALALYTAREARGLGERELGICIRSLRTELAVIRR